MSYRRRDASDRERRSSQRGRAGRVDRRPYVVLLIGFTTDQLPRCHRALPAAAAAAAARVRERDQTTTVLVPDELH